MIILVLSNFDGDHFVCFMDISGFKRMMLSGIGKARESLLAFYSLGYEVLRKNIGVEGIFVSDCAILIAKHDNTVINELKNILLVVKEIMHEMVLKDILFTASVAYGDFFYTDLHTFPRMEKIPLYGESYLLAYLDNELGNPRLLPGLCRIIKDNLPRKIHNTLNSFDEKQKYGFDDLGSFVEKDMHYYYYWMVGNKMLKLFMNDYQRASEKPYLAYKKAIKKHLNDKGALT